MTPPARGLVPVLATPFTEAGEVDLGSLRRLTSFQLEAGADGVAVFGLASEAFSLGRGERRDILATVRAEAGALPIVAGIGATGLHPALDELRTLAAEGANCAMVLPPHMVKPGPAHLIDFYGAIGAEAARLGISVMVQDAPGATGVVMPTELIVRLGALEGITSVKVEAPPTVAKVAAVHEATSGGFDVLGGQNAQFVLDEYASGAVGTMPACEFTDLLAPILQDWSAGKRGDARAGFADLLPLIVWGLQPGLAWAIHKEVLVMRGIIDTAAVRAPAQDLPTHMRGLLHEVVDRLPLASLPA